VAISVADEQIIPLRAEQYHAATAAEPISPSWHLTIVFEFTP